MCVATLSRIEITTTEQKFDPNIAILMDFRVDQSKGMHFMYLLPYSETEALVESTIFSTTLVDEQYYLDSINKYLAKYYQVTDYTISQKKMVSFHWVTCHLMTLKSPVWVLMAGTRPASGYAFLFIQRQINAAMNSQTR